MQTAARNEAAAVIHVMLYQAREGVLIAESQPDASAAPTPLTPQTLHCMPAIPKRSLARAFGTNCIFAPLRATVVLLSCPSLPIVFTRLLFLNVIIQHYTLFSSALAAAAARNELLRLGHSMHTGL